MFDFVSGLVSSVSDSVGSLFSGEGDFSDIFNTILPGSNELVGEGAFDKISGFFEGGSTGTGVPVNQGGGFIGPVLPTARGYSGDRLRLQLTASGRAPQRIYQQIARGTYERLTAASSNRDRCITLVDLVDQGFPSDEIPRSVREGCRSWLMAPTTSSLSRSSTFPTPPYGRQAPVAYSYQPQFPAWAVARR